VAQPRGRRGNGGGPPDDLARRRSAVTCARKLPWTAGQVGGAGAQCLL